MMKMREPFKAKVAIDFSGWSVDDWSEKFADLIKIEKSDRSVTIEMDTGDAFDKVAKIVAADAVQAFFDEETYLVVRGDKLTFVVGDESKAAPTITWPMFGNGVLDSAVSALRWIESEMSDVDGVLDGEENVRFHKILDAVRAIIKSQED